MLALDKIDEANRPAKPSGFGEMPQADFDGAPVSGESVADWVKQLEDNAAREQRNEEIREIRSKAGKHRRKVPLTFTIAPNMMSYKPWM